MNQPTFYIFKFVYLYTGLNGHDTIIIIWDFEKLMIYLQIYLYMKILLSTRLLLPASVGHTICLILKPMEHSSVFLY